VPGGGKLGVLLERGQGWLQCCGQGLAQAPAPNAWNAPHASLTSAPTLQADVWSCGVLLFVTLFCTFPFSGAAEELGGPGGEAAQMHRVRGEGCGAAWHGVVWCGAVRCGRCACPLAASECASAVL